MRGLCGLEGPVHNAGGCPRRAGHEGECYWWLAWPGDAGWQAIVYSGSAYGRRRRCRGTFTDEPDLRDVHRLLTVLSPLKKREAARRTVDSDPQPDPGPDPFELEDRGDGTVALVRVQGKPMSLLEEASNG